MHDALTAVMTRVQKASADRSVDERSGESSGVNGPFSGRSFQTYCETSSKIFFPADFNHSADRRDAVSWKFACKNIGHITMTRGEIWHRFPLTGYRGWSKISESEPDQFLLVISHAGLLHYSQFGREAEIGPGFMVLLDPRNPLRFKRTAGRASYVWVPGGLLRSEISRPEDCCMTKIDAHNGSGASILVLLASLWRERHQLDDDDSDILSTCMVKLLGTTYGKLNGSGSSRLSADPFFKAKRFIEAHLSDPKLSPRQIADAVGISRSHLHAIARSHGESIGQMILALRLEQCRQALFDKRGGAMRITDVAFSWGFNNPAHFSRVFRSRFGVSPRELRKRANSDLAAP